MNFLTIGEIMDMLAGSSNDPFICQRLDELDTKLDALRSLVDLHTSTGTPTAASIVTALRAELI